MYPIVETYVRNAKVIRITDGDTIVCLIDMGFNMHVETPLRLARINAPELSTAEGKLAKSFLINELPVASSVIVQTFKNPKDKYGRWIADIFYNGVCLNDYMVEQNHAIYQSY